MAGNSAVKWNDDQLEAIGSRGKDILVSAGAGSGKTAVMTERIVSLISEGAVSADEILVVTFTKAAAGEMKKKIRDALYAKIKEYPALAPQAAAFENAQISTLHSFAANVLRRFYQTAGIDPAFAVADETRGAILLSDAADEAFEELFSGADEDFTAFAMAFDTRANAENLKETVTYLYTRLAEGIDGIGRAASCVEELKNGGISRSTGERLTEYFEGELSAAMECFTFARDYAIENSAGEKVIAKLSEYISETDSLMAHLAGKGLESFWPRLAGFSFSRFTDKRQIAESCLDVIQGARGTGKEIMDRLKKYTDLTLEEYAGFASKIYKPLRGLIKALRVLDEKYAQAKDRMGVLDFSDLEKLCLKVLGDEDSLSEIKNECRYVFVDEYQDTNDIQEAIINRVASPGRLFTVGDIKQSIYAFRGAKPQLFMKRYDEYSADTSGTKSLIRLTKNYRSTSRIIDAVNAVFSLVMTRTLGGIDYGREKEALEAREDPFPGEKPRLDVIILPKYDKDDPESVRYGAAEINAAEAAYTAGLVSELISSGYIYRKDGGGEIRKDKIVPGDIAILLRTVRGVAPDFTAALRQAGIPAASPEDKPFYDLTEIMLAISLLKVIDNFTDDIALAGVMRSFIYNFSPDDHVALKAFDRALSLHEAVREYASSGPEGALKEKAKYLTAQITGFREDCEKKSLARLIATVYARTNLMGYVSALPAGNVRRENLIRLKDLAEEYEQSALGGLYGFIRYADRARENQSAFRSMDAPGEGVQVISIHKSKGLQYPVVIIPRLEAGYRYGDSVRNTFSDITVNEGRIAARCLDFETHTKAPTLEHDLFQEDSRRSANSEELRLLYVASTRAEQKLFFVGAVTEDKYETYSQPVLRARSERADNALELVLGAAARSSAISVVKTAPGERNTYAAMPEIKEETELGLGEKEELKKAFRDNIGYIYPYLADTVLPAKLSVSALKHEGELEIGSRVPYIAEKPSFMREGSFSGAEAGTLTHRFLQYMDFSSDWSDVPLEVTRQLDRMVSLDIFSADEAGAVNVSGIISFLMSGLGQKVLTADRIEREKEFIMAVDPGLIDRAWEGATGEILIQGKIDLIFFKDGASGIVDYKTDRFRDEEHFRSINASYTRQINVYAAAFERLYGAPPDGLYIAYIREGVNEKAERTGFGA